MAGLSYREQKRPRHEHSAEKVGGCRTPSTDVVKDKDMLQRRLDVLNGYRDNSGSGQRPSSNPLANPPMLWPIWVPPHTGGNLMDIMWDECLECRSIHIRLTHWAQLLRRLHIPFDWYNNRVCGVCGSRYIGSRKWDSHMCAWNDPHLGNYLKQSGETIDGIFAEGLQILGTEFFPGSKVRTARASAP